MNEEELSMKVADRFLRNYQSDTEWGWDRLLMDYLNGDKETKRIMDRTFIHLCGWSLDTLINTEV